MAMKLMYRYEVEGMHEDKSFVLDYSISLIHGFMINLILMKVLMYGSVSMLSLKMSFLLQ